MLPQVSSKVLGPPPWDVADLYRMQVRELRGYAMFMIDPAGVIRSWNAGVEQLLGYSEEEWVGQHACKIFTPEEQAVEMTRAGPRSPKHERTKCPNENMLWVYR